MGAVRQRMANLIPDPLNTDTEYDRFHHVDVAGMDPEEMANELDALRPLLWGLAADNWLRGRVKVLEAALSKRGQKKR